MVSRGPGRAPIKGGEVLVPVRIGGSNKLAAAHDRNKSKSMSKSKSKSTSKSTSKSKSRVSCRIIRRSAVFNNVMINEY
jgi:hypothetical protein